jgi:hypothetical protein
VVKLPARQTVRIGLSWVKGRFSSDPELFLANQFFSLPFSADVDIALGIAVKTYLDDFVKLDVSPEKREADKQAYKATYLPQSVDFVGDLEVAFKFFDAVYDGVKTLGDEISEADKKAWDDAKSYLALRR